MDAPRRWIALVARTSRAFAPALARPDDAFAADWLVDRELALYASMDRRDRDHACRVAHRLVRDRSDVDPIWVRAALLHDVGKATAPYRPWERIGVHLLAGRRSWVRRLPPSWAAALARHAGHAEAGARRIRAAGGDDRVAALVARHHDQALVEPALAALASADGRAG